MAPQYFDNVEGMSHKDITFECEVLGRKYSFKSDKGVFSSHELDLGSKIMIETIATLDLGEQILDIGCWV